MNAQEIHGRLKEKFGEAISELSAAAGDPFCFVADPARLAEVCLFLRDAPDLRFDFLEAVSGVDHKDHVCAVYHLLSYAHKHTFVLKVKLPKDAPQVPTVEGVWSTANWHERETYDLVGIEFPGHSDLRRILLPDDWEGHPLRKDYKEKADYHGISTRREDLLEEFVKADTEKAAVAAPASPASPAAPIAPIAPAAPAAPPAQPAPAPQNPPEVKT